MPRYDSQCNVCGGSNFRPYAARSDRVAVIECQHCGHMVVEEFTDDPASLYTNSYFAGDRDAASGYAEYEYSAEYGTAWAAALVPLIRSAGNVLDIGCANGHAMRLLGSSFQRSGIELNDHMADCAAQAGVRIIARDLFDDAALRNFEGSFDVALALAVFEHVPDFKGAVQRAVRLLHPEGVLIFEVPLIVGPSDIWFRSSLEHIHYPTERSLRFLFESLGLHLAGASVEIHDYGWVYVGITSPARNTAIAAGELMERAETAPVESLSEQETQFRWLFGFIHAAKADPETIALFARLNPRFLNPLLLRRTADLWSVRERRLGSLEKYLTDVEVARDWHAAESEKRDTVIADLHQQLFASQAYAQSERERADALESYRSSPDRIRELEAECREMMERVEQLETARRTDVENIRKLEEEAARAAEQWRNSEQARIEATAARDAMRNSLSWRITRPLRWLAGSWKGDAPR